MKLALALLVASTTALAAQAPVPTGAFVGHFRNGVDKSAIQLVDVRLYFVDSISQVTGERGEKTLETFVDTLRSRIAATDSSGYFAIWRMRPGRYLMQARRIGFSPTEAVVSIDSETVLHDFEMPPIPALLSKVEIREASSTSLARILDKVGFQKRRKFNADGGEFVLAADFARSRPQNAQDILSRYGVCSGAEILIDGMAFSYSEVRDYPVQLIAGIEIYRHGRPVEFNATRRGPTAFESGGIPCQHYRHLVLIWTHIP